MVAVVHVAALGDDLETPPSLWAASRSRRFLMSKVRPQIPLKVSLLSQRLRDNGGDSGALDGNSSALRGDRDCGVAKIYEFYYGRFRPCRKMARIRRDTGWKLRLVAHGEPGEPRGK